MSAPRTPIDKVISDHTEELMAVPSVVGVGQGESQGQPCILVLVDRPPEELSDSLPTELDGYPVKLFESGRIDAL